MQKIVIKNFGPIRDAKIEIRPITVLLGEQATGKSTVAQLMHFFVSLGEDLQNELRIATRNWDLARIREVVLNTVCGKFVVYYGYPKFLGAFDIKLYCNQNRHIWIRPETKINGSVDTQASFENFNMDAFCRQISEFANAMFRTLKQRDDRLAELVNAFLWEEDVPFLKPTYFIAGRNITVGFSETFKTYFLQNYQKASRLSGKNAPRSAQMELTSNFIEHSAFLKDDMNRYGGNFEELLGETNLSEDFDEDFESRVKNILKGKYIIAQDGAEVIKIERGKHIRLNQASSGQQESIRILQDLAVQCAYNERAFRTIEEPEAHLFPSAQNALTELIVMTHNQTGSYFFLTTHSPYFLSSFNNLLYAAKAAGDNLSEEETPNHEHIGQVEDLGYPKHLRLLAKDFAAYQLKDGTAKSIYDPEKAITDIDGLDSVSFEIAAKFETLAEIVREVEYEEG